VPERRLADVFAFPLHRDAAERWMASRGLAGAHAYEVV